MAGSTKKKSFRNVSEKSSRAPALALRPDVTGYQKGLVVKKHLAEQHSSKIITS